MYFDDNISYIFLVQNEKPSHDVKVIVEMSVDEIKKKSVVYNNSTQRYHNRMNEYSFQLCLNNPTLCDNKEQLIAMCRQKPDSEGYNYRKKKSRLKVFGYGSTETSSEPKKKEKNVC